MSSGTSGGIKAGAAFVQAYLDDNPITQGLAKLRTKFKTWQASLSTLAAGTMGGELPEPFAAIARFAQSPAGAFAALLGAAKHTATVREEMLRMSESTGVAVAKLSTLAYAARRAGVSNEALAAGLQKMQGKEFLTALGGGGKHGAGGIRGVTQAMFAAMGQGDAVDRLREFIKLTENMPNEEKIGLAKRMGLSELLPLINQGSDSLDFFTARAKELGLVMNGAAAKAGKAFGVALGDLHDVLMSSVSAIGGALVPLITGLTNIIVRVAVAVRDWLNDHKALTIAIFAGTAAIVAGGIVLKGFAVILGVVQLAISGVQGAFAALSFTISVLGSIVSFVPLLLNPFVLLGAAVLAVVGYITYLSGAFSNLGKQWAGFSADTTSSIKAIANAIAKGDLQQAWDVVTAYFSVEWQRLVNTLQDMWSTFVAWLKDSLSQIESMLKGAAGGALGRMYGVALAGGSTADILKAGITGGVEGFKGGAAEAAATSIDSPAKRARDADLAARQAALDEKLRRLQAAQDAANVPGAGLPGPKEGGGPGFTPAQQGSVMGTFSGAVADLLGGGGNALQQEQVDLAAQDLENSKAWRAEAAGHSQQYVEAMDKLGEWFKQASVVQ